MEDRDSLKELFSIIYDFAEHMPLPLTESALLYIGKNFNLGYDIYYRRRLSVCRMIIDLHMAINIPHLDILLAAVLSNHMPGDAFPPETDAVFSEMYKNETAVEDILTVLRHPDYSDKAYYKTLVLNPDPLIIRLAERAVLLEKLYEWDPVDALRYVRETREDFFPMCIYAKEHYPEYLGAASVLHEKMRNLCSVNDALLTRFVYTENAIRDEILAVKEENAVIRAMIKELKG